MYPLRQPKMAKKEIEPCGSPADMCCCKVESIVSMDDRGQMVLPKEIRERADIRAGDKMALVSWEKDGHVLCISLIKVENLGTMVKDFLGPVAKEIFKGE
jgi:AbrB family looped-hinge helix DNA binding protein